MWLWSWVTERKKKILQGEQVTTQKPDELSYMDAEINNYGKNHVSIHQRSMFQHAEISLSFQIISLVLAHYRLLIKVWGLNFLVLICVCRIKTGEMTKSLSLWVSVQFSSVQLIRSVFDCDSMNRSTAGLPVHHELPKFTQIHVHRVRDAIQPSHPLSFPSPPAPNPSHHQSLFQWVNSSTH